MEPFHRRYYRSPAQIWRDIRALLRQRQSIGAVMRGESIAPDFRERLMLAVTAVNECRYCSYEHARQALAQGISSEEIEALCNGIVAHCPECEQAAILYAQHWAETDANPDPQARQKLLEAYGSKRVQEIETVLRVIRFGNLAGNTADYILYRLSFGRWGDPTRAALERESGL